MVFFSRGPHEYWLKPHFSKNEVAKSGYTKSDRLRTTPPNDYTICNTPIYTLHIA